MFLAGIGQNAARKVCQLRNLENFESGAPGGCLALVPGKAALRHQRPAKTEFLGLFQP